MSSLIHSGLTQNTKYFPALINFNRGTLSCCYVLLFCQWNGHTHFVYVCVFTVHSAY